MLSENPIRPPERRARSQQEIKHLVEARNEALSLYTELAAMQPFDQGEAVQTLLQHFCESLVDYTASAHFQLYRHIDEQRERRAAVLAVAAEIYPAIDASTRLFLDFNDKYDCGDHCTQLGDLAGDLSQLGERLADRIELEDRLIGTLLAPRVAH